MIPMSVRSRRSPSTVRCGDETTLLDLLGFGFGIVVTCVLILVV